MNSAGLLFLLARALASPLDPKFASTGGVDIFTSCFPGRGMMNNDGFAARDQLLDAIPSDGVQLAEMGCFYKRVNTAVLSICNWTNSTRVVNVEEAELALMALVDQCRSGSFAGQHRANGVAYAAYGAMAGQYIRSASSANSQKYSRRDRLDGCNDIGWNGVEHFNCDKPKDRTTGADGNCPGHSDPKNRCTAYCEVKRTGSLGPEQLVPGEAGHISPKGQAQNIAHGTEISITHGFSVGLGGSYQEAVSAGVSYQFSVTHTKSTTVEYQGVQDPPHRARWVYWARFVDTCGDLSERELHKPESPTYPVSLPPVCRGEVKTTHNFCAMSPMLDNQGQPILLFAQQYVDDGSEVLPMEEQPVSYQDACVNAGSSHVKDPDGDGQDECLTDL
ncbi:hypothetical protein BDV96DRAFT_312061 [Lophiotrema nucula]|uniref:Uncharacterized protein n=1 Tax=Lophiotrema nucula TaxID=690887 RepID=A0A6A5ZKL8_9PLEO|nr:hypothetical protein BDV96DRAFT_312061 [Lophiotrema nucula]